MLQTFQIIGFSAGIPTQSRGVSSVLISSSNYDIMIDCGEGTYLRWKKLGYKWKKLRYIIITHMHPDHTGGLIPLLFYRKLSSIDTPLTLIGPPQLESFINNGFYYSETPANQNFNWIDISQNLNITLENEVKLMALQMKHKIACWGYRIFDKYKTIVFITDTLPNSNAVKLAYGSDILIHEATYEHKMKKKSSKHFHCTNVEAMEIADQAKVKRLILTHFSQQISDEELLNWTWNGQSCVKFDAKLKI